MDKERIFLYYNKLVKERKEKMERNTSDFFDVPMKKKDKNNLKNKLNKKNFNKNNSTEKTKNINDIKNDYIDKFIKKGKTPRNHKMDESNKKSNLIFNNNIIRRKNKFNTKTIDENSKILRKNLNNSYDKNIDYDINDQNDHLKSKFTKTERNTRNNSNFNSTNKNKQIQNEKHVKFTMNQKTSKDNSESKCNSADKKIDLYKKFVNNIKNQYNEEYKKRNIKKKPVFFHFLNKFVNKTDEKDNLILTTTNSFYLSNNNNNICKFKDLFIIYNINFSIYSIIKENNDIPKINLDNQDEEVLIIERELKIKQNKIDEFLKELEKCKNEYMEMNNKYNNLLFENKQLKEELINLKNKIYNYNNNNLRNSCGLSLTSNNKLFSPYKNLITLNINKNNNYKIINSQFNYNNYINDKKYMPEKRRESFTLNEKNINIDNIKDIKGKKQTQAFERFKKINKQSSCQKDREIQKSNKISNMAKILQNNMEHTTELENNKQNKKEENKNIFNEDIVNLIYNQPIINNKKKRKTRSFYFKVSN